jgi:16S rRNA (cytosine967-C5)-methyltransferase
VLVDAPCTGTGTWRRRPDTKWRLTDRSLQERVEQQREALNEAATYVRPGGELIYVTCSVLPEENDRQIDAFLQSHPDFKPVAMLERWSVALGDMVVKPVSVNGTSLTLSPATTGTDGFFFAKLKRA